MTPSRSFAALALAGAAVVVLAGCTPTAPAAGGSHSPNAQTPNPTPSQAAIPTVRVPLTCSALFPDATVASMIGVPVHTHVDRSTNPVEIADITARQYGDLACLWGGQDRTDGGYDQYLSIAVAPDAADGFAANLANIEGQEGVTAENTAGDKSEYYCGVDGNLNCEANMLVGTYWVSASLQDLAGTVPQSIANARMQSVLSTVASAVAPTTAVPPWNPPGAALPTFCTDSSTIAQVDSALGANDFSPQGDDEGIADASSFAQLAGTYSQCTWGSNGGSGAFTFLEVALLKGGAWALPQLAGETDTGNYMLGAYAPVTIAGADEAVETCSTNANQCEVMLSIGDLLVNLDLDDPGTGNVNAAVAKIVTAISQG